MIGPPPMPSPFSSASANEPKKTSDWPPVADEITSVTPSVAETTTYRMSGVKAEASTVSQRYPTASESAVVKGTPRMARLATANSQRTRVRMVEAAKTIAYCLRKDSLVKSTVAVPSTALLSWPMR